MINDGLREQLLQKFDRLPLEKQEQLVAIAESLSRPRGVPARSLLKYAGRIPLAEVEKMETAIQDLERIDLNEW